MAAETVTPVDKLSGLPLPLAPFCEPLTASSPEADWHHHFHPRRSPQLYDLGGQAVRNARLQLANYRVHHSEYHGTFTGPPLPDTEKEKFRTVILAAAGYVPDQAIAFNRRKPLLVPLSAEQRLRMQTSGELRMGSTSAVRAFLQHYVLGQHIEATNVNELTIEEFLQTPDTERRRTLGHTLLALITEKATEPISQPYKQARRQQLILPGLPNNVQRFAKSRLGNRKIRDNLVDKLYRQLAA